MGSSSVKFARRPVYDPVLRLLHAAIGILSSTALVSGLALDFLDWGTDRHAGVKVHLTAGECLIVSLGSRRIEAARSATPRSHSAAWCRLDQALSTRKMTTDSLLQISWRTWIGCFAAKKSVRTPPTRKSPPMYPKMAKASFASERPISGP